MWASSKKCLDKLGNQLVSCGAFNAHHLILFPWLCLLLFLKYLLMAHFAFIICWYYGLALLSTTMVLLILCTNMLMIVDRNWIYDSCVRLHENGCTLNVLFWHVDMCSILFEDACILGLFLASCWYRLSIFRVFVEWVSKCEVIFRFFHSMFPCDWSYIQIITLV